jgi:hypothetical protein
MDVTGDTRHTFDPNDASAVAESMARFQALIKAGYTAAKRTGDGTFTMIREFDPTTRETLFIPRWSADELRSFRTASDRAGVGGDLCAGE